MSTIHRIYVGDDLIYDNLTVDDLTVIDEGRYIAVKGHVYAHNGADITCGVINHFMFDSGLTIDEARSVEAQHAYIRKNTCAECGNAPRRYSNEYLMIHRVNCSVDNIAPAVL